MTLLDLGEGVLRLFGVLYALGALWLLNQMRTYHFMDKALDKISGLADELDPSRPPRTPVDLGRNLWTMAGGVLLLAAGVTMALGLRVSVVALAALTLHQMIYFIRQRRRELAATSAEDAEDARPAQSTRNGFFSGLAMLVLAAWLERSGALS
jgi:hypothetical protein